MAGSVCAAVSEINNAAKAIKSNFFIQTLRRQKCKFPSPYDAIYFDFLIDEELADASSEQLPYNWQPLN
jgi:hypothetical protein